MSSCTGSLLLIRIAETTTDVTWAKTADELSLLQFLVG
jgi:hypothetical protein